MGLGDHLDEEPIKQASRRVESTVRAAQTIKVEQGPGHHIYLYVREPDGTKHVVDVDGHRPFLYASDGPDHDSIIDVEEGYESIVDGSPLKKYTMKRPGDVRDLRPLFKDVHEADIPYTQRFMIDVPVNGTLELPLPSDKSYDAVPLVQASELLLARERTAEGFVRSWYDIETGPDAVDQVDMPRSPVYMVCHKVEDEWHLWYWHPTQQLPDILRVESKKPGSGEVFRVNTHGYGKERDMMQDYIRFLRTKSPDTLAGWYSASFDTPYIIQRARYLKIRDEEFGHGWVDARQANIPGMHHIDLLEIRRMTSLSTLPSNSLQYTALHECGIELEKTPGNIQRWWEESLEDLARYNVWDVEATWRIDEERGYTRFTLDYALFTGVDHAMDVKSPSIVSDVLYLQITNGTKVAQPLKPTKTEKDERKAERVRQGFSGGAVRQPVVGIHENVMVEDFSGMYPNIVISDNISYDTYAGTGTGEDDPNKGDDSLIPVPIDDPETGEIRRTHYFRREPVGIMPASLLDLYQVRDYYDDLMHNETDPLKKKRASEMRWPIKVGQNGQFGNAGYVGARLWMLPVAESITARGRQLNNRVADHTESLGEQVIYGDTDSIMVALQDTSDEHIDSLVQESNRFVKAKAKEWGMTRMDRFDVGYEKLYSRYIQAKNKKGEGSKKFYAGAIIVEDGKRLPEPKLEIKGFEYKRGEAAKVTADMQEEIFRSILIEDGSADDVLAIAQRYYSQVRDGKLPVLDCVRKPVLKRSLSAYKGNPEHVRAVKYSQEFLHKPFRTGDRVYLVPIRSVSGPYPRTTVVGLHEDDHLPDGFNVDWNLLADKMVRDKVDRIFDVIGIPGAEHSLGYSRLEDWV